VGIRIYLTKSSFFKIFLVVLGVELRASLARQILHHLSHVPSPTNPYFPFEIKEFTFQTPVPPQKKPPKQQQQKSHKVYFAKSVYNSD
jgi:hypothetical protein